MKQYFKELQFPLGGLDRKLAVQNQKPYTTPYALNVRPETLPDRRMRGGSRPGTRNYLETGVGGRINLMNHVKGARYEVLKTNDGVAPPPTTSVETIVVEDSILLSWMDDFNGSAINSAVWDRLGSLPYPDVSSNPPDERYHGAVGAVRKPITYDTTKPLTISMDVSRLNNVSNVGSYTIFIGLDDDNPQESDGLGAEVDVSANEVKVHILLNGIVRHTFSVSGNAGVLQVRVLENEVTVGYGNETVYTCERPDFPGNRFGFKLESNVDGNMEAGVAPIDYFQCTYYVSVTSLTEEEKEELGVASGGVLVLNNYADILAVAAEGRLYVESPKGQLKQLAGGDNVEISQKKGYVMSVGRLNQLFIADYMSIFHDGKLYKANSTNGTITNGKLSSAAISNWQSLGIVAGSDVATITNADAGVAVGTYKIQSVEADGVVLDQYNGENGNTVFSITVSPKCYDANTGNLVPWLAHSGAVPQNCPLICLYRDRIVLAGADSEPHLWYMSRQGDPYDWNYVVDDSTNDDDVGIAVAGQNSNAGVIGKPIRALIPHSDDYLLFGYDSELWCLRGDPAMNGQLDCLSREVGVIGKRAWCYGEKGEVIFLSRNGLYVLKGISAPEALSNACLPMELQGHTHYDNVHMVYDHDWKGVHLFIEGSEQHWFVSTENGSFWPIAYSSGIVPSASLRIDGRTLIGCADGFIRTYDHKATTDNGVPFKSCVAIGIVRLARGDYGDGVMQRMNTTFVGSRNGAGVKIQFYGDCEAVGALDALWDETPLGELRITKGEMAHLKRLRAGSLLLFVSQDGLAEWWGMERMGVYCKEAGRFRE